jgi:beta-lactamase superfamily II metal-dependent hydrolase
VGKNMKEKYKIINEYILKNETVNFDHLIENKEKSEIFEQLEEFTGEERPEIIHQLWYDKKKYLRFNKKEVDEDRVIYSFSVLTVQLAEFDRAYFEGKFTVEAEEISINSNTVNRVIDTLYKPYYCEAVIELRNNENREKEQIIERGMNGEWISIKEFTEPTNASFPLKIHFSASPFKIKEMHAEWEDTLEEGEKTDVNSIFDKYKGKKLNYRDQPEGKPVFEQLFKNVVESSVHVLRVGQASANYCYTKTNTGTSTKPNIETHKYYFDVGLPLDGNMLTDDGLSFLEEKIVKGYFRKAGPEAVILSHWHCDHLKGAFTMNNVADMVWIAPVYTIDCKKNESVSRLACYIYSKKMLAKVPVDQNPIYTCGDFSLYHGEGSTINDSGFMLQLNSTLMPGDCKFNHWPKGFCQKPSDAKYKYKNLIFPHHGAEMGDKNNRIDCLEDSKDTRVIVPTGYNTYKHPADNDSLFNGKLFTVFPTNPIIKNKKKNKKGSIFTAYFSASARSDEVDKASTHLARTANKEFSIHDKI